MAADGGAHDTTPSNPLLVSCMQTRIKVVTLSSALAYQESSIDACALQSEMLMYMDVSRAPPSGAILRMGGDRAVLH